VKRLFKVNKEYFDNKMEAKKYRDEHPGTTVQLGPDHMGKHGHSSKMRKNKTR
jgi:hypothetical protein